MATGIVKTLLKTRQGKKKKHNKIVMLARSNLNSIESKTSEGLINNEISHEDFKIIVNEERNYRELIKLLSKMCKYKTIIARFLNFWIYVFCTYFSIVNMHIFFFITIFYYISCAK